MTTQEIRDELARMDGWEPVDHGWMNDHECVNDHPHPATLDGAAAAMPEGVKWSKHGTYGRARCATYRAYAANNKMLAMVLDTGDEIHDRYALALAARKAQVTT